MQIVEKSRRVEETHYSRVFDRVSTPGSGCSFECDAQGHVDESTLHPAGLANWRACVTGEVNGEKMIDKGVVASTNSYRVPALGRCDCGTLVSLGGFTNTCESCDADYNSAGQRLAPRDQWGEETGEHPADIARIP